MKKIRDFIYNCNDIFLTLLIIALAGSIILWRAQVIMGYSQSVVNTEPEKKIDIDFSDIDLSVDSGNEEVIVDESGNVETPIVFTVDENFISPKTIHVTIPAGCDYAKAVRLVASAYELENDDYANLYNLLWTAGIGIGADTRIQINTFTIPQGSDLTTIMKIISGMQ